MNEPLERLVERAAAQDRMAVESLLERFLPGLRAFIRLRAGKVIRERESCSDLAQSVCREVLEHMDRFQYPGEKAFQQWLYRTALRKISHRYDYYQADKRDAAKEVAAEPAGSRDAVDEQLLLCYRTFCTPSGEAIAREELGRIEAAFEKLPDEYREVIVLARIMGLSHAEIGRELDRSELAARSLLFRALSLLSELLAEGRAS